MGLAPKGRRFQPDETRRRSRAPDKQDATQNPFLDPPDAADRKWRGCRFPGKQQALPRLPQRSEHNLPFPSERSRLRWKKNYYVEHEHNRPDNRDQRILDVRRQREGVAEN